MISKQVNNTGMAGGHGMSELSFVEQKLEREMMQECKGGHRITCKCGEHFKTCWPVDSFEIAKAEQVLAEQGCDICKIENFLEQTIQAKKKFRANINGIKSIHIVK